MAACQQALLQISSVTHINRSGATCTSARPDFLRATTKFAGLRRAAPLKLTTRERLQRKLQLRLTPAGCSVHGRRGSGIKPILAGLSNVPETNLGLYDPSFDKDSCGVGFVAELSAKPNRKIVSRNLFAVCQFPILETSSDQRCIAFKVLYFFEAS